MLDSVTYFRGGPDSQAVVGDKAVYKHDLERTKDGKRRAPPAGASKSVVIVGPTSHNNEHKQYVITSTDILCCVVFICIYYTYLDNINVYMIILYTSIISYISIYSIGAIIKNPPDLLKTNHKLVSLPGQLLLPRIC